MRHRVRDTAAALVAAAIAWTGRWNDNVKAIVYSVQWDSPRPDALIDEIDAASGPDGLNWSALAIFAITTAEVTK